MESLKLNWEYLKATGLVLGAILWIVIAMTLFFCFVLGATTLNIGLIAMAVLGTFVFVYLSVAITDKLDL